MKTLFPEELWLVLRSLRYNFWSRSLSSLWTVKLVFQQSLIHGRLETWWFLGPDRSLPMTFYQMVVDEYLPGHLMLSNKAFLTVHRFTFKVQCTKYFTVKLQKPSLAEMYPKNKEFIIPSRCDWLDITAPFGFKSKLWNTSFWLVDLKVLVQM